MRSLAVLLCISLILLSTLASVGVNIDTGSRRESYIIELNLPPLIDYWKNISHQNNSQKYLLSYREKLAKIHANIKEWIENRVGKVRIKEYFNVFNGLSVRIPPRLVPYIEKLPFVKRVFPDVKVKALLKDSLPLIGLDKVWRIKNLTGKNVTVAVIDTGIDYNHPDLKNCYAGGYDFVNSVDINGDGDLDDRYSEYNKSKANNKTKIYSEKDFGVDKNGDGNLDDSYVLDANGSIFEEDLDPMDDSGHGTHVCGIIAGNGDMSNGVYRGIASDAKLYVYKVLNKDGFGYISDIISAINKSIDPNGDGNFSDHVDIISMSLGITDPYIIFGNEGDPNDPLSMNADKAVDAGIVVIAAAGNDGWSVGLDKPLKHTIYSPACARKVIAVGASTHLVGSIPSGGPDHVAKYSSKGPSRLLTVKPDIVAPGGDVDISLEQNDTDRYDYAIVSTRANQCRVGKSVDNYYVKLGGTSMAVPHVTGVVALLLEEHPDWDPFEIRAALRYTAKDLGYPMTYQGFGRIDAYKLLNLTSPPPVAIFFDSENRLNTIVFRGVAKAREFYEYELYCKYMGPFNPQEFYKDGEWNLLYSSKLEVKEGILYEWNITNVTEGWYTVKLVVKDRNQRVSEDYILVRVERSDYYVDIPDYVYEGREFYVSIVDKYGKPVSAIVIMSSPLRIPRVRLGSSVTFRAYTIISPKVSWMKAWIWVFIIDNRKISLERRSIIIFNH